MTRKITKSAAAERIHKLAAVARVVQRAKSAGCCGRKPSSKRKRRVFKRSSLSKEASRDLMYKMACAVAVIQRTRGLQKIAKETNSEEKTPLYKNPIAIGTAGGGLIGGTLGAILGPKGQKFLSGLAGAGVGAAAGAGAGYGYTKLKKKPEEEKKKEEVVATPPATGQQSFVSNITRGFQYLNAEAQKWQKVKNRLVTGGMSPDDAEKLIVSKPKYALEIAKNPSLYDMQVEVVDEDGNSEMQYPNGQHSIVEN